MPYITTFTDVGHSKFCGEVKTEDMPTYEDLLPVIRPRLLSRGTIDFSCDWDALDSLRDGLTNQLSGSVVVGGYRPVGSFKIERAV